MKLAMDEQATRRQHFFLHRVTELAQRAEEALPGISESVLPVVRRAVFQQPQAMPRWSGCQPVVGILTRTARDHRYLPENEEIKYQGVSEDILQAVEQAGGVAEIIPGTNPLDYILWKVGQCDVLIAPGTQEADIDPRSMVSRTPPRRTRFPSGTSPR
jgi:peptidase C26-like protein